MTSFVFRNHGVHGGLYPAADAVAPGAGFTPSLDSSPLSSASFSAMRDWHRFPLNVFAAITRAGTSLIATYGDVGVGASAAFRNRLAGRKKHILNP